MSPASKVRAPIKVIDPLCSRMESFADLNSVQAMTSYQQESLWALVQICFLRIVSRPTFALQI